MSDWLHNLPILAMAAVIFAGCYLVALAAYALVSWMARGAWGSSLKAVVPGILSPLGVIFGLFVAFTAAQVWGDTERAVVAVNQEASALRAVDVFAASFPGEPETRLRSLIRGYIQEVVSHEWPMMAKGEATFASVPAALTQAMDLDLALAPASSGQGIAQREIATAILKAIDAHRQRIIVSRSQVNAVKWLCLIVQGLCAMVAIAFVHVADRRTRALTLGLFASGVAACILLIAAHDRPFTGRISVSPEPLLTVMPRD